MASQRTYTAKEVLAILTNVDSCESDGGEELSRTYEITSDSSDEDTSCASDEEKELRKTPRPLPAPGKKTQCQVLSHCNRNHSINPCAACGKYTCRKCRKEGPWLCSNC
ncbi:hypothetical protein SRHO_G00005840 [Serrasalmus rhombeus]